ncbi:MAG TPA: ribosome biogenesis GTPase Der [Candidatus Marinimicrobia bacterium]|nr:ribosome biogenesis GTPase Der [Candidatus Neomarinimicrobiota bacterium]
MPNIAIVGRPNVGKSTFFNRVLSQRQAIVDAQEGITRDRIYGETEWCGHALRFIDTGGFIPDDMDIFNAAVREQAQLAIAEANLILFMVDGRVEPTASDRTLAQFIRESGRLYLLVVNKCDTLKQDYQVHSFHELGMENPVPISALSGRMTGDLLDIILNQLGLEGSPAEIASSNTLRLAIVGMPNVGKSSLTNALLQREQTIVTPIAGTTRDAIDSYLKWHGNEITLVDTAGLRKMSKIKDKIEYYSTVRTQRAIAGCNVALVMIDAEKGFGKQDKAIVDLVIRKGKGLILIVNKWDKIEKSTNTMKEFESEIRFQFRALNHYPVLFISAITRQRVHKVLETAWTVYQRSRNMIPTAKLNDMIEQVVRENPPPAEQGKVIRINYAAQVHRQPAVIAFFTNYPELIKISYRRFLENQIRSMFDLSGIPLKFSLRRK